MCDYSRLICHESSLHVPSMIQDDFVMWFDNALSMLNSEELFVVIAVMYYIWKARNHAVWDGYLPAPSCVWREANSAAAAWRNTHSQQIPPKPPMPLPLPLPTGEQLQQCFIDASFRPQTRTASVGVVLMAHDGGFIAGLSARLPAYFSPLMAESLACKEALSWLKNRGLSAVHIFTDCSTLRDLLNSSHSELLSYVGYSIDASRTLMSSFISCSIHLVPRSHNKAAHTLAAEAFSQETPLYWDLIPPNSIAHLF
ncbi:uncharacterized protein LOC116015908 [Ipomoea triloba]|uniref:uncharacterized protein LOC116015908 n=1 Tax=Ipomoea triloba TaxID=35885 RepID=UPI00125E15F4|nr:uncharacterized protein LOC116015908 [Ipomoea triloba]